MRILLLLLLTVKPSFTVRQLTSYYQTSRTCLNASRVPADSLRLFSATSAAACGAKCQPLSPTTQQWHFSASDRSCVCLSKLASADSSDGGCISWSRLNHLNTVGYWHLTEQRGLTNCGSAGSRLDGAHIDSSLLTVDSGGLLMSGLRRDDRIDIIGMNSVPLSAITVTAWIQPVLSNASLPLWEADQSSDYRSGVWFFPNMQQVLVFSLNSTGHLLSYSIGVNPQMNEWNFIAVTYNPWSAANGLCASINHTAPACVGVDPLVAPITMALGNEFWLAGVPLSRALGIEQVYIGRMKCLAISTRVLIADELLELAGYCG